jgi:peroxiredoxin 2/4
MSLVGKQAPDFAVQGFYNGEIKEFKLSDYHQKWVYLLFYPLDFTFVCPTEVLAFSKMAEEFRTRGCELLGVSVDSQFVHKAWVEAKLEDGGLGGSLNYPLLADVNKQLATEYEVLLEGAGVALRGLFLINPEGVVVQNTTNFLPVGRSAKEALRLLKAFQFVAENGDQVCPAEWDEGSDTMTGSSEGMREYLSAHN